MSNADVRALGALLIELGVMKARVAAIVAERDTLKAEVAGLQKIVDGWAGLVAAHQPSPAGAKVEHAKTYSYCGECERLRETNARLNGRCQRAESAVAEKARNAGPSMGRALANAEAERLGKENVRLREALAGLLTGVSVHNERITGRKDIPVPRIEGPVVDIARAALAPRQEEKP